MLEALVGLVIKYAETKVNENLVMFISNSVLCCFGHEDFQVFLVTKKYGGVEENYFFLFFTNLGLYMT